MDPSEMGLLEIIPAIGALGMAASGLVDSSKVLKGGISNVGFGFLSDALRPFVPALQQALGENPLDLAKANWLNGMAKEEQKTAVRNMIRLGLTSATARALAKDLPSIDGAALADIAAALEKAQVPTDAQAAVLGRFDAIVDARVDAAFERADQKYRNTARVAAGVIAVILAEVGAVTMSSTSDPKNWVIGLAVGLVAVPLAPISKDLTSALTTAATAFKAARR